jgi:FkbM family methyltransferase
MKSILRNLINKFGYDIVKTNTFTEKNKSKIHQVKIGNFTIAIPKHYQYYPNYNSGLGKLALLISKKYNSFQLLDIGANVGDTIAIVKSIVDIPIVAIEGDPFVYGYLKQNASLFNQVYTIQQFLGEKNGNLQVTLEKGGWNTTIVPTETSAKTIDLRTLDQVLIEHQLNAASFKLLKIDAEGFDTIILRGAFTTIEKHHPVLYFEYNRENMDAIGEDGISTLFALAKYGYKKIVFLDNHNRRLMCLPLSEEEMIQQLHRYADGVQGLIPHYDLCLFHKDDSDVLDEFLK